MGEKRLKEGHPNKLGKVFKSMSLSSKAKNIWFPLLSKFFLTWDLEQCVLLAILGSISDKKPLMGMVIGHLDLICRGILGPKVPYLGSGTNMTSPLLGPNHTN